MSFLHKQIQKESLNCQYNPDLTPSLKTIPEIPLFRPLLDHLLDNQKSKTSASIKTIWELTLSIIMILDDPEFHLLLLQRFPEVIFLLYGLNDLPPPQLQRSLYFKTTHGTKKIWSYIAGGLKIKVI